MGNESRNECERAAEWNRFYEAQNRLEDDKAALEIANKLKSCTCARRAYIRRRVQELLGCND